ncbi:PASTA domain-containing protein, partial [Cumulibacter manganitolerans]|uniref:PASTA domain-containing protein n=1 Tax=Cumulibacter manganitolerans TaxID=1884992 RepID=UPI001295E59B
PRIALQDAATADEAARATGSPATPDEPAPAPGPRRRRRWVPALVMLVVVALLAGAGFWWMQYGRWTEVPDFSRARGQQEISTLAKKADVDVALQAPQFSETVGEGYPVAISPKPGTKVTRGKDVRITLSKGLERYIFDSSWLGQPAADILAQIDKLTHAKITVTQAQDYSESVAKDSVISFSPPAGTALKPGETVTMTVSAGRKPVPLPDVAGKSPEAATTALTDAGFAPTVSPDQEFSDVPAGQVARTDPKAGTELQPGAGAAVTIVVSKGPDLVEVPSVTGKTTADAKAALEAAGFAVKVSTVFTTLGLVAAQSPSGGTKAKRGSTVTIQVV